MIHIYTGEGKGKTTAAIGLAIRASGAGFPVYIGQFLKKGQYGELKVLKRIKNITLEQFGSGNFISQKSKRKDIELAKKGLKRAEAIVRAKKFKLIILDEVNIAIKYKLVKLEDAMSLVKKIPKSIDLVLTGRYAHPKLIRLADYVSCVKEIKHPFKKGIKTRKGIEF